MIQNPFLIFPADLADALKRPGVSVVDASWYLPAQNRQALLEFETAHVPRAVFFDQDAIVDPASDLPHTLPSAEIFAAAAGVLGLSETDMIVVYDGLGLFSAPRVWWMLRTFGARDVRLLDGGFPAWVKAGLPTQSGAASPRQAHFAARFDAAAVASLAEMRDHAERRDVQIADARPAERFAGSVPEPRAGIASGHIPGARSLPFGLLGENGRLKSPDALRAVFAAAGIDPALPVVTSCGSGVTAAVINLALASVGNEHVRLYDGSWTQWGADPANPAETGAPSPATPQGNQA